jgi:zinc/manganese transport system permease protein
MYELLYAPFYEYVFMQRALASSILLSLTCPCLGLILVLKRMSLIVEALSHGILPGLALAFVFTGLWVPGLTSGGFLAGLLIAALSVGIEKKTLLRQDASFSGTYLTALALGILLLSLKGGSSHIMHLLFGSVLGIDRATLWMIAIIVFSTIILMLLIVKPLIYQCFDPLFMKAVGKGSYRYTIVFIVAVVFNLVAACQALGTLMALGLMMLPAITARLLCTHLKRMTVCSSALGCISSYSGLILSYHLNLPSGPTIVLIASVMYGGALLYHIWGRSLHAQ